MLTLRRLWRLFDWPLALGVLTILALGLVNLYSATWVHQRELFQRQLWALLLASVLFVGAAALDTRLYGRLSYVAYGVGILLLISVLIFGHKVNGARRWFDVGFFRLQPSELMKIFMIGAVAKYLHDDEKPHEKSLAQAGTVFLMALVPVALILAEPDLGTALIILLVTLTMLLVTKLKLWHLGILTAIGIVILPVIWLGVLQEYQQNRILTFFDPQRDPSGAGWHARQSIFAIGSGRLLGKGFLKGTQSQLHFLPEHWTDFPFAVFGEEWGFVGGLVLLALYLFVILWILALARQARDRFGAMLCVGVAALIFWHVFFNIGMVSGLLPVVGVTLPFVSYGGSSLVTMFLGVGLAMNVATRRWGY